MTTTYLRSTADVSSESTSLIEVLLRGYAQLPELWVSQRLLMTKSSLVSLFVPINTRRGSSCRAFSSEIKKKIIWKADVSHEFSWSS